MSDEYTHSIQVDDHNWPPGHANRVGMLEVRANVTIDSDGTPWAELVSARNPMDPDSEPWSEDINTALLEIEAQARRQHERKVTQ